MPDGSINANTINAITVDADEELPRDGIHLCRRRRSKVLPLNERIIDIHRYDAATRQTPKVGTTGTADVEKAAIELKLFVLTDLEGQLAERKAAGGKPPAKDMLIFEIFSTFLLVREQEWLENPVGVRREPDMPLTPEQQTQAAEDMRRRKRCFNGAIRDAMAVWPENPFATALVRAEQKRFTKMCRKLGRQDSTIKTRLNLVFTMLNWAVAEGLQINVPKRIGHEEWCPYLESEVNPYSEAELAALLNAAGDGSEADWRFIVTSIATGARPDCINALTWPQFEMGRKRLRLNPRERVQTRKRRPLQPIGPTLYAEVSKWRAGHNVHPKYVVTGDGDHQKRHLDMFDRIRKRAGVGGTAMVIRHTVRTWLVTSVGVDPKQADQFIGHADEETSSTSRKHYIHTKESYLATCTAAIEKLFDVLAPLVRYPLGNRPAFGRDPMRASLKFASLRDMCVTTEQSNLLFTKQISLNP